SPGFGRARNVGGPGAPTSGISDGGLTWGAGRCHRSPAASAAPLELLDLLCAWKRQAETFALHGGDPVDHDAAGALGAGRIEMHVEAVGVRHDVVGTGWRELEAGAVVGTD